MVGTYCNRNMLLYLIVLDWLYK